MIDSGRDDISQRLGRFVGDKRAFIIHDTSNESRDCRLGEIPADERRLFDSLVDPTVVGSYSFCPYCVGGFGS